ncbi:MAG: Na/Pi cotransporter family protein, partial [Chloroflexi bacterium]|nr:Na/Pi cotransporter family protein [Chloroflexota bacterium]
VVVQSSSATIGITLALATSGLISFEASVALILGENIGTTITANLAAIGTNLAAKRTAFAHFLFNTLGTGLILILFPVYLKFISVMTPGDADFMIQSQAQADSFSASIGDKPYIARHIANTHTMFNIVNTIIFLPLIGVLAKISTLIIRGEDEVGERQVKFIDNRVLNTPPIAIGQARRETLRMAEVTLEMLQESCQFFEDGNLKRISGLEKREELVDFLQKEITDFLVQLSQRSIAVQTCETMASLIHMVNDLERIGDHCENLWGLGIRKFEEKVSFSDSGDHEVTTIAQTTEEFLRFIVAAMESQDQTIAAKSIEYEDTIDDLERSLRNNHISRLHTGECAVGPGLIFIDMLHNFEKIGDHAFNVSEAILGEK